jgi:hypothetical protein
MAMESDMIESTLTPEIVRLSVPRSLEYVRLVRLTAAGFASRLGYDVEDIDDVRRAVDELASIVVESGEGGELEVLLYVAGGSLVVEGSASAMMEPVVDELAHQILAVVVKRHETGLDGTRASFRCEKPLPTGG